MLTSNTVVAHSRLPIQPVCSWQLIHAQIVHVLISLLGLPSLLPTSTWCLPVFEIVALNACMLSVLIQCSSGLAPRHPHHRCYWLYVVPQTSHCCRSLSDTCSCHQTYQHDLAKWINKLSASPCFVLSWYAPGGRGWSSHVVLMYLKLVGVCTHMVTMCSVEL